MTTDASAVRAARLLGYAGLLPFAGGAVASWALAGDARAGALFALAAYGAVILSFLGAVHWGRLLAPGAGGSAGGSGGALWYAWGVAPSLIGWAALLLPGGWALAGLAGGLLLAWAVDRGAVASGGLPAWYGALRTHLTAGACVSLVAAIPAA